jgi:hypothetical protein
MRSRVRRDRRAHDRQRTRTPWGVRDAQMRKLRAQLLSAMVGSKADKSAPRRLHFRRTVELKEPSECSGVFLETERAP